jgi:hypothetical protein
MKLINSVNQNPSGEADSCSLLTEFLFFNRIRRWPQLTHILSQTNPLCTLQPSFNRIEYKKVKKKVQITVSAGSKGWNVFARSKTGTLASNPAQSMDVCVRYSVFMLGSGLSTGLIPRPRSPTDCVSIKKLEKWPRFYEQFYVREYLFWFYSISSWICSPHSLRN